MQSQARVQERLLHIYSDQTNVNLDKLLRLREQQRMRCGQAQSDLVSCVNSFVQSMNSCRSLIQEVGNGLSRVQGRIAGVAAEWEREQSFYSELDQFQEFIQFKENLSRSLDGLKVMIHLHEELQSLEKMMGDSNRIYEAAEKLQLIASLKEEITAKEEADSDLDLLLEEFKPLQGIRAQLQTRIVDIVGAAITVAKKRPRLLAEAVRAMAILDGQTSTLWARAWKLLEEKTAGKFEKQIGAGQQIVEIIDRCSFVINDLLNVQQQVSACFPEQYKIVERLCELYRAQVQRRIDPLVDQEEKMLSNFGNVTSLLSWIDDYEVIMRRAGLDTEEYELLKSKVKAYVPKFIQHLYVLISETTRNAINADARTALEPAHIQSLMEAGKELTSDFPVDLFRNVNSQIAILGEKLRGQLFINYIATMCQAVAKSVSQTVPVLLEGLDYDVLLEGGLLLLNNMSGLVVEASRTKDDCCKDQPEPFRERIQKLFDTVLIAECINCSTLLIGHCALRIDHPIFERVSTQLFTESWLQPNQLLQTALNTIKDHSVHLQQFFLNPLHLKLVVQKCVDLFIDSYIQRIIFQVWSQVKKKQTPPLKLPPIGQAKSKGSFTLLKDRSKCYSALLRDKKKLTQHVVKVGLASKKGSGRFENLMSAIAGLFEEDGQGFERAALNLRELRKDYFEGAVEAMCFVRNDLDKMGRLLSEMR